MATAFTYPTIEHSWTNADGTPSSGNVAFTLSKAITNGSVTIVPNHIVVTLDATGSVSQVLASNVDAATVPQDSYWSVVEKIMGAAERMYHVQLPSASAGVLTLDLGSLMPGATPPEFG